MQRCCGCKEQHVDVALTCLLLPLDTSADTSSFMMDRRQVPWIILFFVVLFETLVLWQMSKREPVASIQAGDIGCPPIQKDMKQLRDQVTQLTATVDKTEKETKQIIGTSSTGWYGDYIQLRTINCDRK